MRKKKDLSKDGANLRQALRLYQLVEARLEKGEKFFFEDDKTKEKGAGDDAVSVTNLARLPVQRGSMVALSPRNFGMRLPNSSSPTGRQGMGLPEAVQSHTAFCAEPSVSAEVLAAKPALGFGRRKDRILTRHAPRIQGSGVLCGRRVYARDDDCLTLRQAVAESRRSKARNLVYVGVCLKTRPWNRQELLFKSTALSWGRLNSH